MATLRLKSDNEEFNTFPKFLKSYANHLLAIEGKSEKTICEYLLDLRTFFRYVIMIENDEFLSPDELVKCLIPDIKNLHVHYIIEQFRKKLHSFQISVLIKTYYISCISLQLELINQC